MIGLLLALLTVVVCGAPHDPIGKVTWDREIEPIVRARCVSCHASKGRAPMSLATYEEARPWARAIREEVLARRMPKWHAVRGYGDFANDPSLSPFEVALIVAWADSGAPRSRPVVPGLARPAATAPALPPAQPVTRPATRAVDLPCGSQLLPAGTLVALQPTLVEGSDVRVVLSHPAGGDEILLWVRNFDPEDAPAYWLRTPVTLAAPARVTLAGSGECRVTFLFEAQTAR